jgi:dimethylhistidine N-methyltransferase
MSLETIQKELGYTKYAISECLRYFVPSRIKTQKTFAQELSHSFSQKQKTINPKFFYDEKGSYLFKKICTLPEYYISRTEVTLLRQLEEKLPNYLNGDFRLVELGSGSSTKTRILIDILEKSQKRIEYFPIDISNILRESCKELQNDYKNLCITGIIDDYEPALELVKNYDDKNNLIVFLGSSFGNYDPNTGLGLLQKINSLMKSGDLFLLGLDLTKDETVLEKAYNDSQGITAQFNLNVLSRINSELDSDFDIRKFVHHAIYNESQSRVEIYLRSLENQTVNISKASMTLQIKQNELIHTENSCKYTIPKIKEMLSTTGFQIRDVWYDEKQHYCLVLFSKK